MVKQKAGSEFIKIQKDKKKKNGAITFVFSETFIYSSAKYISAVQKQISQSSHSFRAKLLDLQLNSLAFYHTENM